MNKPPYQLHGSPENVKLFETCRAAIEERGLSANNTEVIRLALVALISQLAAERGLTPAEFKQRYTKEERA